MRAPTPTLDFARWVLFRDAHVVAVNKPAGVLSQGGEGGRGVNLVDLARAALGGRIGVLHRLDRNVSGIVLLALTPAAARVLSAALARGDVERVYEAVVRGAPPEDAFTIDAPLAKDPSTNEVRVASPDSREAREARTEARVLERLSSPLGRLARLEVRPITGRSHQLRVHLAHVGLPIVGDPKYGAPARGVTRPLLHATRVVFAHPVTGARTAIESPAPWTRAELVTLRRVGS